MTPRSRHPARCLTAASATAVLLSIVLILTTGRAPNVAAGGSDDPPKKSAPALPPLEVETDAPLLLEKPTAPDVASKSLRAADNSACHVCHTNYRKEPLAMSHAGHGVGCVRCHGASEAHRNDENNITPPETMFPLATLDSACKKCHTRHNVPARVVVARFVERKLTATTLEHLVCTECHGEHRLPRRSVVWDRATGKLLTIALAPAKAK
jgi:hypothetical protein